jgi:hypothetical protein
LPILANNREIYQLVLVVIPYIHRFGCRQIQSLTVLNVPIFHTPHLEVGGKVQYGNMEMDMDTPLLVLLGVLYASFWCYVYRNGV